MNDVVLSVAAGALRRFFEQRDDPVPDYLVALVPVSLRAEADEGQLGNRISTILVKLPVAEPDPRKRLALLRDETRRLKQTENARAASLLVEATGWAPPTINRLLSSAMTRPLVFNLVVSNVPGPQQPLYLLGRRLLQIYPYVPLSPQNHALSLGLISYDGAVFFGLVGDRDVVPDLDRFEAALRGALREQPVPRPKPAQPKRAAAKPRPKAKPRAKAKPRPKRQAKAKPRAKGRAKAQPRAKGRAKPRPGARARAKPRARRQARARR